MQDNNGREHEKVHVVDLWGRDTESVKDLEDKMSVRGFVVRRHLSQSLQPTATIGDTFLSGFNEIELVIGSRS